MASQSAENKNLRKSLKGPDAFQAKTMDSISFLSQNQKAVMVFLGGLIAVMIFWGVSHYLVTSKAEQRRLDLAGIEDMYNGELEKANDQREAITGEIETLNKAIAAAKEAEQNQGGDSESGAAAAGPTQSADQIKADEEKVKGLQEKLSEIKADHSGSSKAYQAFIAEYPGSSEAILASLRLAAQKWDAKDADGTQEILAGLVKAHPENIFVAEYIRRQLIEALDESGKHDLAITEIDALLAKAGDPQKAALLLQKGRILLAKKDESTARQVLNEVLEKHGSSREADDARGYLALMGVELADAAPEAQPEPADAATKQEETP